ncbi:MAG: hypothetical protein IJC15_07750 [Clostridia bacterium]|nr:hypothetical protein [Clostridia bacterium]
MNERYLCLMDRTLDAYSVEHIVRYFADVRENGLREHGFPRLTANMGILIAHGRRAELKPLFLKMMDFCCAQIPQVSAANEFSVREILFCIMELERAGAVEAERIAGWKEELAKIDPFSCYDNIAHSPEDKVHNWACFALVSEWVRQMMGLCDATEFINIQLPTQLRLFEEMGMYRDPHNPMVYDLVPRGLLSILLHFGYRGKYYHEIDDLLRRAGLLTLEMQSVTGEIPYGGRSAQFLHNEPWMALIFEFEARRYAAEGKMELAGRFKHAVKLALDNVELWLSRTPIRHVKNRFPTETRYGCEKYAYFDKYMITAASFLYGASQMCDDSIPMSDAAPRTAAVQTSRHFHKVFLRAGEYFAELDTDADPHYDASGLGRVHRAGAPSPICLTVPCPAEPNYHVNTDAPFGFAIGPAVRCDGGWLDGTAAVWAVESLGHDEASARAVFTVEIGGRTVKMTVCVTADGVSLVAEGEGEVALLLPAFAFDGEIYPEIAAEAHVLTVTYDGWQCRTVTDGVPVDTEAVARNRSGHYRVFRAVGQGSVTAKIAILPR